MEDSKGVLVMRRWLELCAFDFCCLGILLASRLCSTNEESGRFADWVPLVFENISMPFVLKNVLVELVS